MGVFGVWKEFWVGEVGDRGVKSPRDSLRSIFGVFWVWLEVLP